MEQFVDIEYVPRALLGLESVLPLCVLGFFQRNMFHAVSRLKNKALIGFWREKKLLMIYTEFVEKPVDEFVNLMIYIEKIPVIKSCSTCSRSLVASGSLPGSQCVQGSIGYFDILAEYMPSLN